MFYLINKPVGISSFDVIRKLRKILGVKKMGHAGTLDPLTSGCLLIATGNSTKLLPLLDSARKEYLFTVDISKTSDSLDLGTPIRDITSQSPIFTKTSSELEEFLCSQIVQIPPRYSALHVGGRRAYELAREEEIFTLKERRIEVYSASLIKKSGSLFEIRLEVSSGCYIRSFAPIIASFFGNHGGGVITSLQRTKICTSFGVLELNQSSELSHPSELLFDSIFHTIHTYEISNDLYNDIKVGKGIPSKSLPNFQTKIESYIFLSYKSEDFLSLCKFDGENIIVIRNQVA